MDTPCPFTFQPTCPIPFQDQQEDQQVPEDPIMCPLYILPW
jgi:hypothetical protein